MDDNTNKISKNLAANCEPLYLSKHFMLDGHSAEKANGTITYIKYKNMLYGVTCAHVYFHQKLGREDEKILTVFGERLCYQFGTHLECGYVSHFKSLRKTHNDTSKPDIAIIRLDSSYKTIHLDRKEKKPIDLDNWTEPEWKGIHMAMACGFPTEHKINDGQYVSAKFVQATIETTSPFSPEKESFLLHSTLDEENSIFFRGMSGGAIYYVNEKNNETTLIGILFEGFPSRSDEWKDRPEESFLTKNDIQIRGYILTPTIFASWLREADL